MPSSDFPAAVDVATRIGSRSEEIVVESRTLGALRDTLLPKLLSGELRIAGADRFTGGASS